MKRALLIILMLPLFAATGCWHRKGKTKEVTAVATDVEEGFKQRWVDKRAGELVALGQQNDAARQHAIEEFQARYTYLRTAGK
ncbi:MAG: hypothetical protein JWM32_2486 [Verrucomicrobia bacterium]|nr:hypothetical protein [Verrucomicrobiota bacterium]